MRVNGRIAIAMVLEFVRFVRQRNSLQLRYAVHGKVAQLTLRSVFFDKGIVKIFMVKPPSRNKYLKIPLLPHREQTSPQPQRPFD